MKKFLLLLPIFVISIIFTCLPGKVLAAYNPNLVITDAQLTANNTMSEQQIQDFLVAKGSFLANFTVPAPRTVTYYIDSTRTLTTYENTTIGPYGVSTEVDVQGWRASRVIWQVCQWYGVNPQVALTIIEKESSFILGRTSGRADGSIAVPGANSYATYAWLMGYAYTEDTSNPAVNVCGVATPGANPSKSCAGFASQIDNAIWAVANWMNLANAQSTGNNYSCSGGWSGSYRTNYSTRLCDGDWITPTSGATAALYRYTPHTGLTNGYAGNRAFYLIYSNWFDFSKYLGDNIRLSSSLLLSNYAPAIGETVTDTFTIKNYMSSPIALEKVVITGRDPGGAPVDYPISYNVMLDAAGGNDSASFREERKFQSTGVHSVWVSYLYGGTWYSAAVDNGKTNYMTFNVHMPNLTVTGLSINPGAPNVGQEVSITYTVKNNEAKDIKADVLSVGNRLTTQWYPARDFGGYTDVAIPAGQTVTYTVKRTLDTAGLYVAVVSARTGNYWTDLNWGNGVSSRSYYWVR